MIRGTNLGIDEDPLKEKIKRPKGALLVRFATPDRLRVYVPQCYVLERKEGVEVDLPLLGLLSAIARLVPMEIEEAEKRGFNTGRDYGYRPKRVR